jgi:hypothetical protein
VGAVFIRDLLLLARAARHATMPAIKSPRRQRFTDQPQIHKRAGKEATGVNRPSWKYASTLIRAQGNRTLVGME